MLNHYPTRTTTYSNNDQGLLTSVDGPLDGDQDTTRFAYDEKGNQTHVINALGHEQVTKAFDESGRPLVVEDANGVQTTLAYNTRGWLAHKTTQTPQGDATTIFTYANSGDYLGQGQIAKIISPDGSEIFYEYDTAYRLIAIHNGEGERIDYTLDLEGNRIAEKTLDATGHLVRQQQYIYDELSRLLASVGADQQTTRFEYDKNGNRAAIIDGRNHKTAFAFDVLNRLVTTTDAADGVIKQTYTSQGQVTSITDQRALTTEYRYNGFGEKIAQISPDTGETTFAYNKAGKLIAKTDARGEVTTYQYDLLGRMLHTHYPSNHAEDIHYRYDQIKADDDFAVGRLSQVLDASGETTYFYNQTGRLDRSQYRLGDTEYGMEYRYNLAGQLMAVRYPSGRWVNYERDSQQRIAAITTDAGQTTVASQMSYLPFGPIKSMLFGNGLSLDIMRDQDYRISAIEVTGSANDAIFDLGYQYDEASNIVAMDDYRQRINSQYFEYDALNRLTSATGSYGNMAYHYDGVSNRLGREQRSANGEQALLEQYQYADDSNRLLSVNQQQGKTHNDRIFAYDAVGNMLRDDRNNQGQRELVYNASNRLAGVAITEKASTRYIYNAKGQRVIRQVTTLDGAVAETHFHYDQADQLVAETDSNGKVIKEYIYHAKQQIAVVDYDSNTQGEWVYLHNDHLGTPKLATNSDQAIVWQADALPFGEMKEIVAEMNQPLRFPGQTLDQTTGYYYNYFRDYDPSLGRYIQSDPIGLAGGVNTYGYVLGNPVVYLDYFGLNTSYWSGRELQSNVHIQNFIKGAATYPRGAYRAGVHSLSVQGVFGKQSQSRSIVAQETAFAVLELARANPEFTQSLAMDYASNNKALISGRFGMGALVSSSIGPINGAGLTYVAAFGDLVHAGEQGVLTLQDGVEAFMSGDVESQLQYCPTQ